MRSRRSRVRRSIAAALVASCSVGVPSLASHRVGADSTEAPTSPPLGDIQPNDSTADTSPTVAASASSTTSTTTGGTSTSTTTPAEDTTTTAATTAATDATTTTSPAERRYTIAVGDSWAVIATSQQTTVPELLRRNGLVVSTRPVAGTVLLLGPAKPLATGAWRALRYRSRGAAVAAVQRALIASGVALRGGVDGSYGRYTVGAVRAFQSAAGVLATGGVDATTAALLGVRAAATPAPPPTTSPAPPPVGAAGCQATARGAVIDRARQRAWLCRNGEPLAEFVVTTARSQPDPRVYRVWSKSRYASGSGLRMQHFTVFARGKERGARVGFHSVPTFRNGSYAQSLDSVGSLAAFGNTHGCIRTLPNLAATIFGYLTYGDPVVVIS